jgi:hypothetical protein
MRGKYNGSNTLQNPIWSANMENMVLTEMRRSVVESLISFARRAGDGRKTYLTPCKSWEEVKDLAQRGCVLWYSSQGNASTSSEMALPTPGNKEPLGDISPGPTSIPNELATVQIPNVTYGNHIAVHNLERLLGAEHLGQLRQSASIFKDNSMLMFSWPRAKDAVLGLWRLEGYLAMYGEEGVLPTPAVKGSKKRRPETQVGVQGIEETLVKDLEKQRSARDIHTARNELNSNDTPIQDDEKDVVSLLDLAHKTEAP